MINSTYNGTSTRPSSYLLSPYLTATGSFGLEQLKFIAGVVIKILNLLIDHNVFSCYTFFHNSTFLGY